MKQKKCTCLLPFYNEADRVVDVLSILARVSNLDEIICIDDGSTDDGYEKVKKHFPSIQIIHSTTNLGKSAAVAKGLTITATEYVLLMDADLWNLKEHELENGISYIFKHPSVDMLIFRRKHDPWFSKILRGDILVSGERIVKTENLRKIFQKNFAAYQIEIQSIITCTMRKKLRVGCFTQERMF